MRGLGLLVLVLAGPAGADGWERLDSAGISGVLSDARVYYDNEARQDFLASGRTLYTHGEASWGYWRAEDDRYCSQWPPNTGWDCYDVFQDGQGAVRFADDYGNLFDGQIDE